MSKVPLYLMSSRKKGPPRGGKGSKGRNLLDCVRGKGPDVIEEEVSAIEIDVERLKPTCECQTQLPLAIHHARLLHRGTSLIRKRYPLGPYRRPMPRVLGGS